MDGFDIKLIGEGSSNVSLVDFVIFCRGDILGQINRNYKESLIIFLLIIRLFWQNGIGRFRYRRNFGMRRYARI